MKTGYAFKEMKENMARALFRDLDISTKASIETANFLRGRTTEEAKKILNRVIAKKQAIPFKRFTDGVGHRAGAGLAAGRFPLKACKQFIAIIEAAEANAQAKGLSSNLKIVHLAAQKGTNQYHAGRQRRRMFKRTHLEIVVEEQEKAPKETKNKTSKKEAVPKKETKQVKEPQEKEIKVEETKSEEDKK